MKNVALFFGSFNPIHKGHLAMAKYIANYVNNIDEVRFIVSPRNPDKKDWDDLEFLSESDRLDLVKAAIEDDPKLSVSDIEFNLPKPSYTYDTLMELKKQEPSSKFYLVMGADNICGMSGWKNYKEIMEILEGIFVFQRDGIDAVQEGRNDKVIFLPDSKYHKENSIDLYPEYSSTEIRKTGGVTLLVKDNKGLCNPEKYVEIVEKKTMDTFRVIKPKNEKGEFNFGAVEAAKQYGSYTIFLAGPCPRHDYSDDWRNKFIQDIRDTGLTGTTFITPTNDMYDETNLNELELQTDWELESMENSEIIVFNLDKSPEHPGFTTNIEVGYWLRDKEKCLVFYCPEGNTYGSNRYLKIKAEQAGYYWFTRMEDVYEYLFKAIKK